MIVNNDGNQKILPVSRAPFLYCPAGRASVFPTTYRNIATCRTTVLLFCASHRTVWSWPSRNRGRN